VLADLPLDDPEHVPADGGVATPRVFQPDGGPMRQLLRACAQHKDISAGRRCTGRARRRGLPHNKYARRKTGREEVGDPLRSWPSCWRRFWRDSFNGSFIKSRSCRSLRPVTPSVTLTSKAMGKKKSEVLEVGVRPVRGRMKANGFSSDAVKTLCGTSWSCSLDYAFNSSTRRRTGDLLTDRRPLATTGRVLLPLLTSVLTTRTRWRSLLPANAAGWGSRCCCLT